MDGIQNRMAAQGHVQPAPPKQHTTPQKNKKKTGKQTTTANSNAGLINQRVCAEGRASPPLEAAHRSAITRSRLKATRRRGAHSSGSGSPAAPPGSGTEVRGFAKEKGLQIAVVRERRALCCICKQHTTSTKGNQIGPRVYVLRPGIGALDPAFMLATVQ